MTKKKTKAKDAPPTDSKAQHDTCPDCDGRGGPVDGDGKVCETCA